jgi:hypothetical protein
MRTISTIILAVVSGLAWAIPVHAQSGIHGGWNSASVSAEVAGSDVSTEGRSGWHIGGFAGSGGLIGFQLGAYYSQKGFSVDGGEVSLDYIEFPLMLRAKFLMLRGYGGINLAVESKCEATGNPTLGSIPFDCGSTESFEFGWKLGAGAKFLLFTLDLAYEWGTTDIWAENNGSIKNRVFQVSAGVAI